jgi:hypothetical protein
MKNLLSQHTDVIDVLALSFVKRKHDRMVGCRSFSEEIPHEPAQPGGELHRNCEFTDDGPAAPLYDYWDRNFPCKRCGSFADLGLDEIVTDFEVSRVDPSQFSLPLSQALAKFVRRAKDCQNWMFFSYLQRIGLSGGPDSVNRTGILPHISPRDPLVPPTVGENLIAFTNVLNRYRATRCRNGHTR